MCELAHNKHISYVTSVLAAMSKFAMRMVYYENATL